MSDADGPIDVERRTSDDGRGSKSDAERPDPEDTETGGVAGYMKWAKRQADGEDADDGETADSGGAWP